MPSRSVPTQEPKLRKGAGSGKLGAKRDIYTLLDKLAADGVAVVMLSTEVDEHVELMDRVLVFREGAVGAVLDRDQLSRAALVSAFFGQEVPR